MDVKITKVLMAERSDLYHDGRVQKEAESLTNNGYKVAVIGLRASKENLDSEYHYDMKTKYVLPRKFGIIRKLHLFLLIAYLNFKIIFIRSDYYHAHNTYFLPGMIFAKFIFGGKLVYDAHEVQWELNKIAKIQEALFIKSADYIINVSKGRAKAQAEKYNIPSDKIHVISNYPNLDMNLRNTLFTNEEGVIRFVFSGGLNLSDNKIDNFIRAIKAFPQISLDLLVFSYSNSATKIKKLINELNLESRVRFIPLVKPGEVLKTITNYNYSINLMINPNNLISINYHSINKIYEAISAGLPILCSDLPAFKEEIVQNGIGYSVDPYSIESIKKGIELLLKNHHLHGEIRNKAFELAITKFNWYNEEKKLLNLYKKV
jgi:glycosyltransferase involved in cell wall biosynthesis